MFDGHRAHKEFINRFAGEMWFGSFLGWCGWATVELGVSDDDDDDDDDEEEDNDNDDDDEDDDDDNGDDDDDDDDDHDHDDDDDDNDDDAPPFPPHVQADICSRSSGSHISQCVRSMLVKLQPFFLSKLITQALMIPAARLAGHRYPLLKDLVAQLMVTIWVHQFGALDFTSAVLPWKPWPP